MAQLILCTILPSNHSLPSAICVDASRWQIGHMPEDWAAAARPVHLQPMKFSFGVPVSSTTLGIDSYASHFD